MGFTGRSCVMDGNGDWSSKKIRKHRSQSPCRDVSPVPSHYSEPVSFLQRRDVIAHLPRLPGVREPIKDEDDDDDVRSHKSLPAVMTALTLQSKQIRSHKVISGLPPLINSRCTLIVKGTGCKTGFKLPPITKSKKFWMETDLQRPPCRAGYRLEKMEFNTEPTHTFIHPKIVPVDQTALSVKVHNVEENEACIATAGASGVSPRSRLTFQSPVVQAVYPISPDDMQQMRQADRACRPLRSVLKKAHASNSRVFDCPLATHLLEPFSGFQEHLCRQILHSPLPFRTALPQLNVPCRQDQVDLLSACRGPYSSLMERTVELCNSQGQMFPKITMTCPTPSPKRLCRTAMRHAA